MTRLLLLGDCHAAWHRLLDGVAAVAARDCIDLAIQVGDFGFFGQYSPAPLGGGFCGGALHADRRQEGCIDRGTTNWLTLREAKAAAQVFSQAEVDLIVTNSCPHSLGVGMKGSPYLSDTVERYCTLKGHNTGPISDCGEPGLTHLWGHLTHRPRRWVFGHFHIHHEAVVDDVSFQCIGAIDGSDGRAEPIGYILDTTDWRMTPVVLT